MIDRDWSRCFICQVHKDEPLRTITNNKIYVNYPEKNKELQKITPLNNL